MVESKRKFVPPIREVTSDELRLIDPYRCLPRAERNELLRHVEVRSFMWRTPADDPLPYRG